MRSGFPRKSARLPVIPPRTTPPTLTQPASTTPPSPLSNPPPDPADTPSTREGRRPTTGLAALAGPLPCLPAQANGVPAPTQPPARAPPPAKTIAPRRQNRIPQGPGRARARARRGPARPRLQPSHLKTQKLALHRPRFTATFRGPSRDGLVAQLVEQCPFKALVQGSSPCQPTT